MVNPFSKDLRTDADKSVSLLYSEGIIMSHSHRDFFKPVVIPEVRSFDFVKEGFQRVKFISNFHLVVRISGHPHHTAQIDVFSIGN